MKVYIVCSKKPSQIVDVYSDIRAVREVISKNPDNLFSIEKDLLETAQKFKSMAEVNEKVYDPKHFNSIMPFGKYKGQTIGDIIQEDPGYLLWCKDNLSFEMDEECLELIEYSLEKKGNKR